MAWKLSGEMTPTKFSLLMPDQWNGKFMMGGGGGFVGSVQNMAAGSIELGYATVGTDTGHTGGLTDAIAAPRGTTISAQFTHLGSIAVTS